LALGYILISCFSDANAAVFQALFLVRLLKPCLQLLRFFGTPRFIELTTMWQVGEGCLLKSLASIELSSKSSLTGRSKSSIGSVIQCGHHVELLPDTVIKHTPSTQRGGRKSMSMLPMGAILVFPSSLASTLLLASAPDDMHWRHLGISFRYLPPSSRSRLRPRKQCADQ
jgi:hypothetical protein